MQPTISIPQHWGYPRFALDQRTKYGIILGFYYYPNGTELAEQIGNGWRYALMPNKNSDELFHFQESQIKPLSPQELFSEITAEIELYQSQIAILQQQLAAITGDRTKSIRLNQSSPAVVAKFRPSRVLHTTLYTENICSCDNRRLNWENG